MSAQATTSIRRYLLLRVVALVLLTIVGFVSIAYVLVLRPAQDELARVEMARAASGVESDIGDFITDVERVLRSLRDWGRSDVLRVDRPQDFAALAIPLIDARPHISGIQVATGVGRSIRLARTGEDGWLLRESAGDQLARQQRRAATGPGAAGIEERLEDTGFDARTRPWFTGAAALRGEGDVHWTEPYQVFGGSDLVISAAMRWSDRANGETRIVAVNVRLADLSRFTSKVKVGEHGRAAILSQDGRMLGMPADLFKRPPHELEKFLMLSPHEANFPVFAAAYDRWLADGRPRSRVSGFEFQGEDYVSRVAVLQVRDRPLVAISVAPRSDFQLGTRGDAFAVGALLASAVLLAYLLARLLSQRFGATLRELVRSSERIGEGQLDAPVSIATPVRELARLVDAQERMRLLLLGATRDLEKRIAERTRELAETERWYRSVIESAPDGMIVVDESGTIRLVNRGMQGVFGYSPDALVGQNVAMLVPEETRSRHADLIGTFFRAPAHRAMGTGTLQGIRSDGRRVPLEISLSPLPAVDERTTMVAVSIRDVTERRRAEMALRVAHEEQSAIFESASAGIALVRNARIERCNRRLEEMFGHPEATGMALTEFMRLAAEEREETTVRAREQLARGETYRRERLITRRDGSTFWCRLGGHAIDPGDLDKGSVWMLEDVTEEHAAAEALVSARRTAEEATRAKSMFLASMSHEIRTPMNGVLGMLQLLALTRLDAGQKGSLDAAQDSAKALLRIIDDLLDFSKIEAGKLEIRPEVTSVASVIESVRDVYSGVASAKDLALRASCDPDIAPALRVDPLRLRQILNNFVSNAIKFTERGSVEITANVVERAEGSQVVRLAVTDTGIGVSSEAQAQLFQPYVQASIDTARRFGGTGLGLTICRRLADMMGGAIAMQSEPGRGTTMAFTLSMPVADPRDLPSTAGAAAAAATLVASRRAAPTVEAAREEGTLVLMAEDHPTNRHLLTRLLNLLGYAVVSAEDGRQALEKWQADRFALVVTDCNMPVMDGYQLAEAIRAREADGNLARTPIIACTANAFADQLERCTAAGMDDFVAKPIDLQALAQVMERWLPLPAGERRVRRPTREAAGGKERGSIASESEASPIDPSSLAQVTGGDAAMEREILADFRTANDEDMQALRKALADRDLARVVQAAHRVKGACRMVGANALASVTERVEKAGREKNWKDVEREQGSLEREAERLTRWLAAN